MTAITNKTVYSHWYAASICRECEKELTRREIYGSYGICPYCGHDSEGTICSHRKSTRRRVEVRQYFFGLIPIRRYIKTEVKTNNILDDTGKTKI